VQNFGITYYIARWMYNMKLRKGILIIISIIIGFCCWGRRTGTTHTHTHKIYIQGV